jgi:hypothetical protein
MNKITLRGATLAEVLVMMIVAGVVLTAVMDGLGLLRRYTVDLAGRIAANGDFYNGYYRLADLVAGADSITGEKDAVVCWRAGTEIGIVMRDSMLVAAYGRMNDTLISRVEGLRFERDTLTATVLVGGDTLRLSFAPTPSAQAVAARNIEEIEKGYEYE